MVSLLYFALLLPAQAGTDLSGASAFNSVAYRATLAPRIATRCTAKAQAQADTRAAAQKCAKARRVRAR